MKNLILSYNIILILFSANFLFGEILKPNSKNAEIVKITDENNKTRTYYHLSKNKEIVFDNLDTFIDDSGLYYGFKVISRAKISPNSNSSKTFGVNLKVVEDNIERNRVLKYKKGSSLAKKSSKSGFSYTQAGFWFEELTNLKSSKIIISLIDGSPELDLRVVIDKINDRESTQIIKTVNKQKTHKVAFINNLVDSVYIKTKGWNELNANNQLQYKIQGPAQVRVLSRTIIDDNLNSFGFSINQNGRFMSDYFYKVNSSKRDAHIIVNKEKINLSNYESFFINVPDGISYYTVEILNEESPSIFLKLQTFEDKLK